MKLILFNERLPLVGGTEIYVDRQARILTNAGHEVVAVCAEDDPSRPDSPFLRRYVIPSLFNAAMNPSYARNVWHGMRELREVLAYHRPDAGLLHIFDSPVCVRLVQTAMPTLRFVHTPWTYCPAGTRWLPVSNRQCQVTQGLSCFKVNRTERCMVSSASGRTLTGREGLRRVVDMSLQASMFRHSTLVCANSQYSATEVATLSGRSDNIRVLPPPIAPSTASARRPRPTRILFAGRVSPEKGLADIVRAVARLPEVELVVAGDGPDRAKIQTLVESLGVDQRITWLGWVSQERLDVAIQESVLVVLPSLWAETFGLVGLQAAMNRRPTVGYDSGGIRDWLAPGIGVLVAAGDVPALTTEIDTLIRDPALAERLGESAYAAVQRYLPARHGESLSSLVFDSCRRWLPSRHQAPIC